MDKHRRTTAKETDMSMNPARLRTHMKAALADALRFDRSAPIRDVRVADAYWLASKITGVPSNG